MTTDLNIFIYLITGIFGTYIVYKFMGIFFDRDEINKRIEFLTYLIYFLVSSTAYLALNIPMFTLAINLILFFALTFNYKGSIKSRVFAVFFMYLILASIESIIYLLSGFIRNSLFTMNPIYFSAIGIVSVRIVSYMVVLLIGNYKTKQRNIEIPFVHWISILLIPLGSLYIIIKLMEDSNLNIYSISASIGILLGINMIAFYLYEVLTKIYEEEVEKTMLKEQNKYYQSQLNILDNTNEKTRKIRLDMEKHISIAKEYIQAGEKEKAINYLDQISKDVYKDKRFSQSGNMNIDSILNYKLNEAIKKDIYVSIESELPSDINISSLDIVVVLGNLLDEVIRETSKVKNDRRIGIKMRFENNMLFIHIENTFDNSIDYEENRIKIYKKDKKNHGIGLRNIERILDQYNGLMNMHYKDNKFTRDIIMYIN